MTRKYKESIKSGPEVLIIQLPLKMKEDIIKKAKKAKLELNAYILQLLKVSIKEDIIETNG
jgi:hypothetical protein